MTANQDIDSLLKPFQRFGVNLGLDRINHLLNDLGNPHDRVPIIHVTGTNGKGSVCSYLASVLAEAGYKVGKYTSPHLVDWTERICIDEQPISTAALAEILLDIQKAIDPSSESPTQFEVITAAAWLYFERSQVDIAVMEVGLGGRLDATNVCANPLVTAIVSISLEHWQNLGPTVADIAREKAGILKRDRPAVIGILPDDAFQVVSDRAQELNCPTVWVQPAIEVSCKDAKFNDRDAKFNDRDAKFRVSTDRWAKYQDVEYPLPLLGEVQLINSAIAIASIKLLQQQGWQIPLSAIQTGMAKTRWLGRLQWTTWNDLPLLIDGAHNPAAARSLRQYIDTLKQPITWVMGMLSTKDHADIFKALLREGDRLYLVPVPDHSTADPIMLAELASNICPNLQDCQTFGELFMALKTAFSRENETNRGVVLCGSLYLLGYFLKHCNS
ncbi:MAG: bifunctional folylpolyglutamate synthase/dihydrofolate synthase [Xenococcaceae cyanobacterium]